MSSLRARRAARLRSTSVLAALAAAGVPAIVHAQDVGGADDQASVGEIVVTAQRREESINDVGMSIQALSGETLQELRITNVRDLTTVVPSFTVAQSYQGVPTYTMRGIGFNTINLSATSTVGTYTDEVAYAYPIMNTGPIIDIERVEVLKGPQGTLYGRNTTAGLINFVTGKPTDEAQGAMTLDLGNYETVNAGGYVSGPLSSNIQARFGYRVETSDKGWQISNSRNERLGEVRRYGFRGSLAAQAGIMTADLSATYWVNKSDTIVGQGIGFTPATNPVTGSSGPFNAPGLADYIANNRPTRGSQADWSPYAQRAADIGRGAGLRDDLREDNWFVGLKGRLEFDLGNDISLISLTGYNEFSREATFDWSGAPYEILIQQAVGKIESFAQEVRLQGSGENFNWLVGGYYARDKILDSNRTLLGQNANVALVRFVGSTLLGSPFNNLGYTLQDINESFRTYYDVGNIRTRTWSVFANADYAFSDLIKLNVGARYTEDKQRYTGCSGDVNGSMLPNVNVFNRAFFFQAYGILAPTISENECNTFDLETGTFGPVRSVLAEDNFSWRVALDVTPSTDTLIYASISRGAKAGTTPINAANLAQQNAPVRQEYLTAYEVGAKLTLFDRAMQANVAGFYYDYKDKQISAYFADPIYTALARLDNVPKSRAYGIEGEVTVRPVDGLTLIATALWLDTKIQEYVGTNAAGQEGIDFSGTRFIYSPKFQSTGTALLDLPVSDTLNFTANVNVRYQSRQTTIFEDDPLYDIRANTLVNGGIGIKASDDSWSVGLWGRNLFNEYYWNAVASNANVVVRFPGQTRTYGLTAGFRF